MASRTDCVVMAMKTPDRQFVLDGVFILEAPQDVPGGRLPSRSGRREDELSAPFTAVRCVEPLPATMSTSHSMMKIGSGATETALAKGPKWHIGRQHS